MRPDVLEVRINLRVAELKVIAAQQFCQARACSDDAASPGVAGALWHRPSPSAWPCSPFTRPGGDGRTS